MKEENSNGLHDIIAQVHSAPLNGRWCGDQRPPCGLSGRLIMC